ncbi:alpha/beta fold hydrolase [Hymenobacter sp. ASUV-10]|uniref:Alpha/beta fold hydrolase n=1 Tax=Hymenobacter aranciens TaxID=3063996 RepID=A0ABT9B5I2_9BACT|nr:alpha/beta fold hydrolase [Hymenobacter sp. ASUV-10]MDO7873531.1 alpha/beta fold hydrolase [Hymenobacter sp. ASUV-10]
MNMHHIRLGTGKPLLLIHGIGGSWRSWNPVLDGLSRKREVIALDLPGHGQTPKLPGENSFYTLADALESWLRDHNLVGVDCVGSSMGARLVLELARRGVLGAVVSLDPGGFWEGWQVPFFYYSVAGSVRLVRLLQPLMPAITGSAVGRTLLLAQFSARPWRVPADVALTEMRSFARTTNFDEVLKHLAYGQRQAGAPRGSIKPPLVIGWGRQDRVLPPSQAPRALAAFPDASLYWFDKCGHFPHWDQPQETVDLILAVTSQSTAPATAPEAAAPAS